MVLHYKDLKDKEFGRLKAVSIAFSKKDITRGRLYWNCICICGQKTIVQSGKLLSGHTKSCGCLHKESITKHGLSRSRFYRIYKSMLRRSGNEKYYKHIKVCESWKDFLNFKEDMYEDYLSHSLKFGEDNTTIDRINGSLGYNKDNCRWATYKVQNNNLANNRYISYMGKGVTISQLYSQLDIKHITYHCFYARINRGWSISKASKT